MRQWLKVLLIALIIVMALLLGGVFVLTQTIDPGVYQHKIERYLRKSTGREVKLLGKMKIDYFPSLGLSVPRLVIPNPQGFSEASFADIQQLNFRVRVLPLFLGKVEIGRMSAEKAVFNLVTDKRGKINWDLWTASPQNQDGQAGKNSRNVVFPLRHLAISSFKVSDSELNISNQQAGFRNSIDHIDFEVRNFSLDKAFPLHLAFDWSKSDSPVSTSVKLDAMTVLDVFNQRVSMPNLSLKALVRRPDMPVLPIHLSGDFELDRQHETLDFSPLTVKLANMKVDESLHVTHLLSTPHVSVLSQAENVSLGPLVRTLTNRDSVAGWLSFTSSLTATGKTRDAILKTAQGEGDITVKEGMINGFDFSYLVSKADAYLHQTKPPALPKQPLATRFSSATASYTIHNGLLSNQDLEILATHFKATGKGHINLLRESIDYHVTLSSLQADDIKLPVKVSGDLSSPSVQPNWDALVKQYLQGDVDELIQGGGKKLKNALDSLLK